MSWEEVIMELRTLVVVGVYFPSALLVMKIFNHKIGVKEKLTFGLQ